MHKITFSKTNSPLMIMVDGVNVGRINRNHNASAFVVDFPRIQWRDRKGEKLKVSLRGGQSCVWIKRLKDAKELATIVATAYAGRLIK